MPSWPLQPLKQMGEFTEIGKIIIIILLELGKEEGGNERGGWMCSGSNCKLPRTIPYEMPFISDPPFCFFCFFFPPPQSCVEYSFSVSQSVNPSFNSPPPLPPSYSYSSLPLRQTDCCNYPVPPSGDDSYLVQTVRS